MELHIIYTEAEMLISKKSYSSWQEIQKEHDGYKASLGPWHHEQVIDYLSAEYSNLLPSASEQVVAFVGSTMSEWTLSFC
ncbi:hypothetical protein HZ993_14535 [Rhodoferax sp. AJA081-3]|uniref:hypothetical protein n=1 Tax=Rhodoferax sp. AJA081-3 TaxID=2752316 RepID=UPI001BB599A0|nr:hypothetical protein [Rhodoferax sp. AJA081-3]QTN26538.1 hypothetical protein HZ993_14535 [Rhodoferax sp. AJA081-3]